ncbi:MAG TPA: hypothetical protein VN729_07600 [Ktedonobacteraceae bacterium]|nr:hypothetical protein [Ktedonobacteraceae bacterium]
MLPNKSSFVNASATLSLFIGQNQGELLSHKEDAYAKSKKTFSYQSTKQGYQESKICMIMHEHAYAFEFGSPSSSRQPYPLSEINLQLF